MTEKDPMIETKCKYFQQFQSIGGNGTAAMNSANMRGVKPTRSNIWKSLVKCNAVSPYPTDELQEYVMKIAEIMYGPILTQPVSGPDSVFTINPSSSPSRYWKDYGCKDKSSALKHPDMLHHFYSVDHVPLVDYNGKVELLEIDAITKDNKIRGTFNPPLDFILKEKLLYDNQNDAILRAAETHWIKYGFVKQGGGFNRLAKLYERFEILDNDDVIGWDRLIALIGAMLLRNKFLLCPKDLFIIMCYVTFFVMHAFVVCPDGVVRWRKSGNISGSNNTTTTNSLAHLLVLIRFICNLYLFALKRYPTFEEIVNNHLYSIYSDDNLGGHNISHLGITIDDFYRIKVETYKEFGLTLKPSQHLLTKVYGRIDPRHEFLGSSFMFVEKYGMYVPYPRVNKLASTLIYSVNKLSLEQTVAKALAITLLSSPEPELHSVAKAFTNFLLALPQLDRSQISPQWQQWLQQSRGRCTDFWINMLLGRENCVSLGGLEVLKRYNGNYYVKFPKKRQSYKYPESYWKTKSSASTAAC